MILLSEEGLHDVGANSEEASSMAALQEHFRLGIFTSATVRTATEVLPKLEAAAGPGPLLFSDKSLLLHRSPLSALFTLCLSIA